MKIVLENIANGTKLEVIKIDTNKWINEHGIELTNERNIRVLNEGKLGTEIGSVLYETRYAIIDVRS